MVVQIHSFGPLTVEIAGKSVMQSGKNQRKILELLATIIALGGRNVNGNLLKEILWPDAEGDLADLSLGTSLHRLRKLIGKEAVLLNTGMVSLNDGCCWLDLWIFETISCKLEHVLKCGDPQPVVTELTDQLMMLYRGTFLKNYDSGWILLKQEQLLDRLIRLFNLSADFYEQHGDNERTSQLLSKVLELKPLSEASYRRLMQHYIKLGWPDQALHIYRQCQRILCGGFNIPLSSEIHLLARQLQAEA